MRRCWAGGGALVMALKGLGSVVLLHQLAASIKELIRLLPKGPIDVLAPDLDVGDAAAAVRRSPRELLLTKLAALPFPASRLPSFSHAARTA